MFSNFHGFFFFPVSLPPIELFFLSTYFLDFLHVLLLWFVWSPDSPVVDRFLVSFLNDAIVSLCLGTLQHVSKVKSPSSLARCKDLGFCFFIRRFHSHPPQIRIPSRDEILEGLPGFLVTFGLFPLHWWHSLLRVLVSTGVFTSRLCPSCGPSQVFTLRFQFCSSLCPVPISNFVLFAFVFLRRFLFLCEFSCVCARVCFCWSWSLCFWVCVAGSVSYKLTLLLLAPSNIFSLEKTYHWPHNQGFFW